MGLGLLLLVSVGKENLYLSGQPEITYFKLVYKQYTNFSIETIPQYFKTDPDFSRKITINISKNADLLNKLNLYVKLPSIPANNHSYLPNNIKKFRWIEKIGLGIIKNIDLEIGGIFIDRLSGDFLNMYNELHITDGLNKAYNIMIGNTDGNKEYTNGKESYELQIPLNFWFCQDSGLSLPLVALAHNDVKIHIEFNSFNKCFMESPTHYITVKDNFCLFEKDELIKQNVNGNIAIGRYKYFDVAENRLYFDRISNDFIIPPSTSSMYNIIGDNTNFSVSLDENSNLIRDESYFPFNYPSLEKSYILANYVYLDNNERWYFIKNELEYLVPLVNTIPEKKYYSSNVNYKIDLLNNPVKTLFWRGQLLSNFESNDLFNYTIYPLDNKKTPLLKKSNIIINSIPREEEDDYKFYSNIMVYKNDMRTPQDGIFLYSFSLHPKEYQPSGSLNFNKLNDAYISFTINNLVNYQNPILIKAYAIEYNIFRIIDGLGSLVFM
jgi:hypothetical protein